VAEGYGTVVKQIISFGGGAKRHLLNQIKADITGRQIVTLKNPETASLGAAIIAGVGSGVFEDYQDACGSAVNIKKGITLMRKIPKYMKHYIKIQEHI